MKNSEILTCLQCGTCHASCPSGRYTSLNIRRIIRDSINKDVSNDPELWMCTTCYNCQERCPRGIKVTDAILALRSEAARGGKILPDHRKICRSLIETGHAVPIDDKHRSIREKLGLGIPTHRKALDEVKILLESTKFNELIEE